MKHLDDQTLADYCYQNIKEAIIKGEFAPGENLRIAKLKSHLNAGPTPIREALSRLTSSGLVEMEANKGFIVKDISELEVRDIYSTFNKIELLALDASIDHGDVSWEAAIMSSLYKLSAIEKTSTPIDPISWLALNYEFHYALIAACNSPCLLKIREEIYQLFDRYCHLSLFLNQKDLSLNHKDHVALAQAIINRDKPKSFKLITAHLENSLEQVIERLKPIFKKNKRQK